MRTLWLCLIALAPFTAHAQSAAQASAPRRATTVARNDWRVTLTIFRSPGTGLQVSKGHLAAFVAHYPTVIKRDGAQRGTQFVRLGLAAYARPDARTSPYASVSFAPSLTKGWSNSALADVGARQRFGSRYSGQLGVALLYAPHTKQTRVNPTVGLGVRF
ncbi:hypothetical protein [Gemmatimonas groenlandica]|uniref:DUF3575 domain-containing protein n=1 Tax=Gemmatimonas groenlandica TaxID=2732249 RepID=A0A6M4INQ4_9BACT|nr:hypothetical protein [Gemmatimonas groenlandica]QJR35558.1 hypothetical protein HKW67_08580 [Gemmatimonas groenlandica]